MAKILTDNKYYSNIANAIRAKNETNDIYKPSEMADAIRTIGCTVEKLPLPEGYTQLTYIQSTGTQYIDTGYAPNQNTRIILDAHVVPTTSIDPVFGARVGLSDSAFGLWLTEPDAVNPQYGNVSYGTQTINMDFDRRLVYELNKNVFTVDGITKTFAEATFSSTYPMYLFQINNFGEIFSRFTKGKIYSCKIYDNDVLVRDFVPCINPSVEVGLYDMVNGVFYGNAGSGVFSGAPLVNVAGIPCFTTVETEAGATVTATFEDKIVTATADENGIATLILNKEGTWNITGTLNSSTKSTMVEVYHEIAEEIDLSNKFYINFLGNIYEYEFESGMTWNDFLLSDYNDNLGAHDVKLGYNVGPATITNALDFFGAPVLTEEFNKEKIDPNILIFPLNPDSANFSPVNGKTYIVHIDTFENVPWATVSAVSKAGKAQNYWSIGDTKTESSQTYRIIGFDHDDVTDAASYGRSKAGITLQLITIMGTAAWSSSSITTWKNSKIRTNQLPLYMDDLPATFKNYLVPVNKLAANSTSYGTKTTETVSDTFFLLAINEIQSSYSNAADEGDIYAYYAAGNSKALDSSWWTRSLRKGSSSYRSYIVSINTSGSATQTKYSSTSTGLAWACCI